MFDDLSPARRQIALDQLHSAREDLASLIHVSVGQATSQTASAFAIAIQPKHPGTGTRSSVATIVHAGTTTEGNGQVGIDDSDWLTPLKAEFDAELISRGVDFVQWSTDCAPAANASTFTTCRALGLLPIADLEYLSRLVDVTKASTTSAVGADPAHRVELRRLDWDSPAARARFSATVEETYVETLDCPALKHLRTTEQTLEGYQQTTAFDGDLWFNVLDRSSGTAIGCVILAHHRGSQVIELVYMGLVPLARGRRTGAWVLDQVFSRARQRKAERVILAVDRANLPARSIYVRVGFEPLLSETVWAKSLALS